MFTTKDINIIPTKYFHIIHTSAFAVTLHSKCTGHDWHIIHQEYCTHKNCIIYHRHKPTDSFHLQCSASTLENAIHRIQSHDTFHCKRIKNKARRTRHYKPKK